MAGRPTPPARDRGEVGGDDGPAPSGLRTPLVSGDADERDQRGAADARAHHYASASGAAFDAEAAAWPGLDDDEEDDLLLGVGGGSGPGAALRVSFAWGRGGVFSQLRARALFFPTSPLFHTDPRSIHPTHTHSAPWAADEPAAAQHPRPPPVPPAARPAARGSRRPSTTASRLPSARAWLAWRGLNTCPPIPRCTGGGWRCSRMGEWVGGGKERRGEGGRWERRSVRVSIP